MLRQLPRGVSLAWVAALAVIAGCDKPADANASPPPEPAPAQSTAAHEDPPPEPPYDPCAGKACGDPCTICSPDDADCVETMVVKACDASGECTTETPACGDEVPE